MSCSVGLLASLSEGQFQAPIRVSAHLACKKDDGFKRFPTLQLLGKRAQGEGGKKVQAAMIGVLALLEALEEVMQPGHYIQTLLVLLREPQEALLPRIVRLFEASLSKATDAPTIQAAVQFCVQVTSSLAFGRQAEGTVTLAFTDLKLKPDIG